MTATPLPQHPPSLHELASATADAIPLLRSGSSRRQHPHEAATAADQGADVLASAGWRLTHRHLANYLAAAEIARSAAAYGPLLDVGCGTGAYAAWLADRLGLELHLHDADPAVLRAAVRAFPHACPAPRLSGGGWAGVVTAMEVVEHLPHYRQLAFLRELLQQLRPGGLLVLSTPDESRYPGGWSGYPAHVGCLTAPRLRDLLRTAGGEPVVWRMRGRDFDPGWLRMWTESVGNRVWARVPARQRHLLARAGRGLREAGNGVSGPVRRQATVPAAPRVRPVEAVAPEHPVGSGLLAAMRRPLG